MARDYTKAENLDIIEREARERHIPVDDFMRFAYIETGGKFDEQASRGPNSAKGLFQFTPGTAEAYGIRGRELDAVANTDAAAHPAPVRAVADVLIHVAAAAAVDRDVGRRPAPARSNTGPIETSVVCPRVLAYPPICRLACAPLQANGARRPASR